MPTSTLLQVLALELPAADLQLAPAIPDPSCHVEACKANQASTSSHAPAATTIPEPQGSIASPAQRAQCQTAARNAARAMRQAAGVSARGTLLFVTARCLLLPPAAHAHIAARQAQEEQRDEQVRVCVDGFDGVQLKKGGVMGQFLLAAIQRSLVKIEFFSFLLSCWWAV